MEEDFSECQINRHPEVRASFASEASQVGCCRLADKNPISGKPEIGEDAIARAVDPSRLAASPLAPQDDGSNIVIEANPYVLQELAKEPGEREHEIISYRRRHLLKPHGYPLSGRDGAGKRVLFHSDEKEKYGASEG